MFYLRIFDMLIGTIVKLKRECLGNSKDTRGIFYEVYSRGKGEEGASIIFENGKYDGFSAEEQREILIPIGISEDLMNYEFEYVGKLIEDFRKGVFDLVFIKGDQIDTVMNEILRINEKVLKHLLKLREAHPDLYFVPRKINKAQKFEQGYWFRGNKDYLNLSFWDGADWKEQIHNIGFVVLENKTSSIEFSAQDSNEKAQFLSLLANKLGGFKKLGKKNRWQKPYQGKDYLANLNHFITNVKPVIDRLIAVQKPEEIELLNEEIFNGYLETVNSWRNPHLENGRINKIARICWNTKNWKIPSGPEGKSTSIGSYEYENGFGHEEWLFNKSRIIDGYYYSFFEPLRLKSEKHIGNSYNISLFTINSLNKKYYVGEIKNAECISKKESERIFGIYRTRGWIEQMKNEVKLIGGKWESIIATNQNIFFNVRFKFSDAFPADELIEISDEDISITTHRFKLLPKKTNLSFNSQDIEDDNESDGNEKSTGKRKKVYNVDCEFDPYHDMIQNALVKFLRNSGEYVKVQSEKGRVDIKGKTANGDWHYFELKTDNPKLSIRKALGQVMEYAYFPNLEKAKKLIIVADSRPNSDTINYLNCIRSKFNIPVSYRYFELDNNFLSEEF